jgi:hypothetical protein
MKSYQITVLIMGIGLAAGILLLVRRDHIYIRQGLFWIFIALVSLVFGIWPSLIDAVGRALGVAYPPTLLLLVAIIVLVMKALLGDIALTKVRRDLRRLNQRMALIEAEVPVLHAGREARPAASDNASAGESLKGAA